MDLIQVTGQEALSLIPNVKSPQALRLINQDQFAASGFVHYGWHDGAVGALTVNEGISCNATVTTWANRLGMGRVASSANNTGTSLLPFAMTHIAGFISQIHNVNLNSANTDSFIKFPEAPNGTVIHNSTGDARGSGKATLDLSIAADPKYGDTAADTNEAVARAFEGIVMNGDFRNGTTSWTVANGLQFSPQSNGSMKFEMVSNGNGQSSNLGTHLVAGKKYKVEAYIEDSSGTWYLYDNGTQHALKDGYNSFTFTAVGNSYYPLRKGSATTGQYLTVKYYFITPVEEEVVIDRHDMFGGEFFLEKVTETNPDIYDRGMIQSQATSINGVATADSTRAASYFAVYDGDTGSVGKAVNWFTLSEADKAKIAQADGINLFRDNEGNIYQWRMRQRTIAGAGNGNWDELNLWDQSSLRYDADSEVAIHGTADSCPNFVKGWDEEGGVFVSYARTSQRELGLNNVGVYHGVHNGTYTPRAEEGLAFFHVWGVVRRLNQGGYHPSFNPLGTRAWNRADGTSTETSGHNGWYGSAGRGLSCHSAAQCFNGVGSFDATSQVHFETGSIGGKIDYSGHQDGRRFDAIYDGGDGGVNDHRLSAWDMSSKEEASKIFQKVVNGTYRGEERVPYTEIVQRKTANAPYYSGGRTAIWVYDIYDKIVGKGLSAKEVMINGYVGATSAQDGNGQYIYLDARYGDLTSYFSSKEWLAFTYPQDSSVSGEFEMVDVFGDPDQIRQRAALANGWQGGWITTFPSTTTKAEEIPMTRKCISSRLRMTWSDSATGSWSSGEYNVDSVLNSRDSVSLQSSTRVGIYHYTAWAKMTVKTDTNPVFNGDEGLGTLWQGNWYHQNNGVLLTETLLGKVATNNDSSGPVDGSLSLNSYFIDKYSGKLTNSGGSTPISHSPISLVGPSNDSPAVKTLWHQTSDNGQVGLDFAWNELVWVGAYADIGVIEINDAKRYDDAVAGKVYLTRLTPSVTATNTNALNNKLLYCLRSFSASWNDQWIETANGYRYVSAPTSAPFLRLYGSQADFWGDDGTFTIVNGTTTVSDINGNTRLVGTAKLAKKIGYSKNKARAGAQVKGVDLLSVGSLGNHYAAVMPYTGG